MEIILHGKRQEEKDNITFKCAKCGCTFITKKGEYHEDLSLTNISYPPLHQLYANCPECFAMCNTTKKDEINLCEITTKGTTPFLELNKIEGTQNG